MTSRLTAARWSALTTALGLPAEPATFSRLVAAYSEPQRHYHTADHISACLGHFDQHVALFERPAEAELALWFHDAVYDPHSATNEADSAEWAGQFLRGSGADAAVTNRVVKLILATEHGASIEAKGDAQIVVDIDLSILGSSAATYERFEQNVRREYAFVPLKTFRQKRSEILRSFLNRPVVYGNAVLRAQWEQRARGNMAAALQRLAN